MGYYKIYSWKFSLPNSVIFLAPDKAGMFVARAGFIYTLRGRIFVALRLP